MANAPPEPKLKETQWTVEQEVAVSKELGTRRFEPNWKTATKHEKVFTIDTPPPYPSGRWHIGAVAGYSLIDIIARSRRMLGEKVLFPWGLDRNGINIELTVEKKFNKRMHTFGREEFLELCRKEIEGIGTQLVDIAKRVGMSCDFDNAYATDAPEYRAMSQAIFIELWNKGHIVEDLRPNNYCPDCKTTIADAEVYYEERDTVLNHVKWDLEKPTEGVDHLIIATTRPELMAACQIVLVNPDDDRFKRLHGEKIRIPTYDRSVEIRPHPTVDPAFGTGAMMICSYGDSTDVALFRELALQPISAIGIEGTMTEATGHLAGLYVKKARAAQIEKLKGDGRIVKEEQKKQKFPICERSKTPIELIQLKEWYVKQVDFVNDLRKHANEMEFHPEKHRQILLDWIDTVTIDWPISRRRYYHTEIPVWYCKACRTPHVPKPGPYYQPWKQPAPAEISKCRHCGKTDFVGEEKVFDTWMDSSSSQMYVLHYLTDRAWFDRNYPCSIRCNGRDIIRTWLYYSTLKSRLLLNQKPYHHAWITGLGMDEKGRKMSKSLGNVIDPDDILKTEGADAFRFWAASECTVGDDFRISKDRIGGARKFLSKVYNVARFVSSFPEPTRPAKLDAADEWILAELNQVIQDARAGFEAFDFFRPSNGLRDFVWNLFAPHYLEMAKRRAFNGDTSATWTLHASLRAILLLLAPISPFLPYRIANELYGMDVHDARLPAPIEGIDRSLREKTSHVESFNSSIWKQKKEKGLSLNAELPGIVVPAELAAFRETLTSMHNLQ
jgi:valyl-tRNA synthetase